MYFFNYWIFFFFCFLNDYVEIYYSVYINIGKLNILFYLFFIVQMYLFGRLLYNLLL